MLLPGAFNMTTGPAHWELLQRARAIDNQLFVATCSPARNPDASYQAWGHSTVVSPWAQARRCDGCNGYSAQDIVSGSFTVACSSGASNTGAEMQRVILHLWGSWLPDWNATSFQACCPSPGLTPSHVQLCMALACHKCKCLSCLHTSLCLGRKQLNWDVRAQVLATTDEKPGIVYADLDYAEIETRRLNMPIADQKRSDLYALADKAAA